MSPPSTSRSTMALSSSRYVDLPFFFSPSPELSISVAFSLSLPLTLSFVTSLSIAVEIADSLSLADPSRDRSPSVSLPQPSSFSCSLDVTARLVPLAPASRSLMLIGCPLSGQCSTQPTAVANSSSQPWLCAAETGMASPRPSLTNTFAASSRPEWSTLLAATTTRFRTKPCPIRRSQEPRNLSAAVTPSMTSTTRMTAWAWSTATMACFLMRPSSSFSRSCTRWGCSTAVATLPPPLADSPAVEMPPVSTSQTGPSLVSPMP
mmetsp:Transcript_7642/g.32254  ORF Transcript_7642/g.32254 Transcript_7642/m.32254 type:complete len:263 (-) Transcript_7642:315-1103(-)